VFAVGIGENFVVYFPETHFLEKDASINVLRMPCPLGHFWTFHMAEKAVCLLKKN
jgi:hypothetical protein